MGCNIVCLPNCYSKIYGSCTNRVSIPRKKKYILAAQGLTGKVHLESDWTEEEVFNQLNFFIVSKWKVTVIFYFTYCSWLERVLSHWLLSKFYLPHLNGPIKKK